MSSPQTTAPDPRHQNRVELMELLFAFSFYEPEEFEKLFAGQKSRLEDLLQYLEEIDEAITKHAPERPLTEINKVDLAILRLSVYEDAFVKTPKKVIINEAVELAKEFGSENSPKFVNGVLGKMLLPESLSTQKEDHDESTGTN